MKKSNRNKTIDFEVSENNKYLNSCVKSKDLEKLEKIEDITILGDIFNAAKHIPEQSIDLIIADPPYNLTKKFSSSIFKRKDKDSYVNFSIKWLNLLIPKLKTNGTMYICSDWQTSILLAPIIEELLNLRGRITWQREKGRGSKNNWKNCHEDIWYTTISEEFTFNLENVKSRRRVIAPYRDNNIPKDWIESTNGKFRDTHPSNFWDDITIPFWSMPENTAHPTQKPEKLIAKLILASSNAGDIILDPFLGSGTTSVVAKKLGRKYIGVEIEPEYCAWAQYRIEKANKEESIQGYSDGVFWERNTLTEQKKKG